MKRKTTWIIALIAIPLVAAVFTLHAQTKDNGRDEQSERTRSLLADEQSRIESSEFDLRITVSDTDGKPLDGVTMELELKRPKLPLLSGEWESHREKEKTDKSKITKFCVFFAEIMTSRFDKLFISLAMLSNFLISISSLNFLFTIIIFLSLI